MDFGFFGIYKCVCYDDVWNYLLDYFYVIEVICKVY